MRRRPLLAALPVLALAACAAPNREEAARSRAVVFFTSDSAALDEGAQQIIARAAERAKANPNAPVVVRGFAAPDNGTGALSRSVAEARSRSVAERLVENGVGRSQLRLESRGAVPFEQVEIESRRVEIVFGG